MYLFELVYITVFAFDVLFSRVEPREGFAMATAAAAHNRFLRSRYCVFYVYFLLRKVSFIFLIYYCERRIKGLSTK